MSLETNKAILLSAKDNVATMLIDINADELVTVIDDSGNALTQIKVLQNISFGNKLAVRKIENQEAIYKSGFPIGIAIKEIPLGELVHVQNVRSTKIDIPETIINQIIKEMEIQE